MTLIMEKGWGYVM